MDITTARPPLASATPTTQLPVVVLGAGPVGLAAAAHLEARGLPWLAFEAGDDVGASVLEWAHIRTFTPWRYIVDPTARRLLAESGWDIPATDLPPTGRELVELYLRPLARRLGHRIHLGHRVAAVSREGMDKTRTVGRSERPFVVRVATPAGVRQVRARAVVDATGTWGARAPLGASGLPALGEAEAAGFVTGPLPDVLGADRERFAGRRTLVVGAGHSAANTLLALARLAEESTGTQILWAIRGASPARVYGGGDADQLAARGRLGTDLRALVESGRVELVSGFAIGALEVGGDAVSVVEAVAPSGSAAPRRLTGLHTVVAATGFRPDLSILSEVQLDLDPALEAPRRLAPLIDPQFHSCGTVPPHGHRDLAQPDEGLYVVGMKSYGRAPTFLITTGNEQVRSVVAAIAGDLESADRIELVLPETGVCSVDAGRPVTPAVPGAEPVDTPGGATSCGSGSAPSCGPPADDLHHRALPVGVPARGFASGVALASGVTLACCT